MSNGLIPKIEVRLVDNDAALSLPSDRVFELLGSAASQQLLNRSVLEGTGMVVH